VSAPEIATTRRADLLSVENVSVRLGGRKVLSDVSFRLGSGELAGLIGANGAGKTTLMRVVLGLLAPETGQVLVAGKARPRRQRLVGYLPQQTNLDPDLPLRARDLVALGLDGHRLGLPRPTPERRRRVDEVLEAVDATSFADARVGTLSGGQQRRVLIAHALVAHPKLLLLDEPFASLDIAGEQEIVSVLARIVAEHDIGVLVSTHDVNPLLPVMDRVVYVAAGHVASGTPGEVVNTESLSRLYGRHVDVIHLHGRVLVVAGAEVLGYHHAGEPGVEVI
jgi:zinc/manganese transport system ATP-binding protein